MKSRLIRILYSLTIASALVFAASLFTIAHSATETDDTQETSWQELMTTGVIAAQQLDFAAAEKAYKAAATSAEKLSLGEQYLAFGQLIGILEQQAKYTEEEQLCRKWTEKAHLNSGYVALACVLMKQNRLDESMKILKDHPMDPSDLTKLANTWLNKEIQVEVRKNWKPPSRPMSNSTQVVFCIGPGTKPAAYVALSSDDKNGDLAAIKAIEQCSFEAPPMLTEPATVQFTFDYNLLGSPIEAAPKQGLLAKNKVYQQLRKLLAWQDNNLGKEHIEQASTLCSAATILKDLGNLPAAQTAYRKALQILDDKQATTHATLTCCSNLGAMLMKQKNYKDAEVFLQRECKLTEQFFGPKSSNYTEVQERLAKVQRKLKK